jgi:hypothetical protein
MKRALILAAGCALLAGPALAQSPPPGPDRDGDRMERRDTRGDRDWRGGGAEAIGMKAGVVAGATAVATDMVQAFGSKAGIRAWRYDVTQMSPCGPASTRL